MVSFKEADMPAKSVADAKVAEMAIERALTETGVQTKPFYEREADRKFRVMEPDTAGPSGKGYNMKAGPKGKAK